ncbi:FG-GAP repeat domain-containing protein [Streptomyces aureocirculatus]|uniref:FG-GAP repeat domain-containing protein n=1 Tax=Streptomyces aureocirculatus TaxID=67275 RepID=UPI0004C7AC8B|nr:VCBS repeat-containing protein [Streptomyces aureocirculatus]
MTTNHAGPAADTRSRPAAATHAGPAADGAQRPGGGRSRQARTLLGSALASVLALGVAAPHAQAATPNAPTAPAPPTKAPAAATAVPTGLGPWTAPKELPGVTGVADLKATSGGTVVGLFTQDGKAVLAVRPADATAWQPATPVPAPGAALHRTDDGAVSLLWWTDPADDGTRTLKASRLAPDGTVFGPAEDITTGTLAGDWAHPRTPRTTLAANAAGHRAVAWMDKEHRLTVVERSGPSGSWSAPKTLDRLPDPIVRDDNVYHYTLWDLRLAVDKAGTVGVLWGGNSYYTGDGVDPDPTAYKWHYKYVEKSADSSTESAGQSAAGRTAAWTEPGDLPQLGEKPKLVAFAAHPQGGFHLLAGGAYARKAAGAAAWGQAEQTGVGASAYAPADLLTAPNGDVTAVGMTGPGTAGTAVRRAKEGSWGGARKLASYVDADSLGAAATADGTVVVTYTQKRFEASRTVRKDFVAQTVRGGDPAKPRTLSARVQDTWSTGRAAVDAKGRPVAAWTQADPAVGGGPGTSYTATTGTRAKPKWHDYADDTRGDIVGLSSSDSMKLYTGDASNPTVTFSAAPWDEKTRVVPFGDFDGDRSNDLVVRLPGGEARLYTPVPGGIPTPDSPYKRLARDWSRYDTLFASGDQTGDGRPDLLARDKASGDVYLYAHDGADGFKARVKVRSAWTGYTRVVGAGDLNGDGTGDVLALDKSGELWRYDGLRTGRFKDRVPVFKDWGASYKDVIGAGDVNGDGKHDLLSRDTGGRLWLNPGKGNGTFADRTAFGAAAYWKEWASLS